MNIFSVSCVSRMILCRERFQDGEGKRIRRLQLRSCVAGAGYEEESGGQVLPGQY